MASDKTNARPINHIALSVTNAEAAVDWYTRILGFRQIGTINHIKRSETPDSPIFKIYPADLNELKLACLTSGNGVGFEIFEFIDPAPVTAAKPFHYNLTGVFHICVTDPNPASLAKKAVESGGQMYGDILDVVGAECLYVADPWGNIVEIINTSFDSMMVKMVG